MTTMSPRSITPPPFSSCVPYMAVSFLSPRNIYMAVSFLTSSGGALGHFQEFLGNRVRFSLPVRLLLPVHHRASLGRLSGPYISSSFV